MKMMKGPINANKEYSLCYQKYMYIYHKGMFSSKNNVPTACIYIAKWHFIILSIIEESAV